MAQDIVGSLFGATPQQVQSEMTAPIFNRAQQFAQLNPMQQAQYGLYSGGAMLGQGIGGLLGGEDPRLVQARQMQQVKDWIGQSGVDINTSEGLTQAARYAQSIGATEGAMFLGQQAQKMKAASLDQRQSELGIQAKETEIKNRAGLQQALANMPENIDRATFIKTILPFVGNSADAIKLASSRYGFDTEDEKLATKELDPGDGLPYIVGTDNVGRIKLSNNRTIPRASFDAAKSTYDAEDTMLTLLNDITEEDIQNAYGATMDYTTVPYVGRVVPETTDAQQKIKGVKIQETLRTLGPLKGSTSDKEFSEIMSGFPAFTQDPEVMSKWIERAKKYMQKRMQKGVKEFGFDRSSNLITQTTEKPTQTSSKYKIGETRVHKGETYIRTEAGWVKQGSNQ